MECGFNETSTLKKALFIATFDRNTTLNLFYNSLKKEFSQRLRRHSWNFAKLSDAFL